MSKTFISQKEKLMGTRTQKAKNGHLSIPATWAMSVLHSALEEQANMFMEAMEEVHHYDSWIAKELKEECRKRGLIHNNTKK